MSMEVDTKKLSALADKYKKLSNIIESTETELNKNISRLVSGTNSKYSEKYVRDVTSELTKLLNNIRTKSVSLTTQLHDKQRTLNGAVDLYKKQENDIKKLVNKDMYAASSTSDVVNLINDKVPSLSDNRLSILTDNPNQRFKDKLKNPEKTLFEISAGASVNLYKKFFLHLAVDGSFSLTNQGTANLNLGGKVSALNVQTKEIKFGNDYIGMNANAETDIITASSDINLKINPFDKELEIGLGTMAAVATAKANTSINFLDYINISANSEADIIKVSSDIKLKVNPSEVEAGINSMVSLGTAKADTSINLLFWKVDLGGNISGPSMEAGINFKMDLETGDYTFSTSSIKEWFRWNFYADTQINYDNIEKAIEAIKTVKDNAENFVSAAASTVVNTYKGAKDITSSTINFAEDVVSTVSSTIVECYNNVVDFAQNLKWW